MKVKSFLLTALAASMTFVACDNNDNEMGQLDNTPKSVSVNLSNVISTRGAGQAIKDDSKVSLADLQVFFTNGTTLYKGKTVSGTTFPLKAILTVVTIGYSIFYLPR